MALTNIRKSWALVVAAAVLGGVTTVQAQRFVPGTGAKVQNIGDDFEGGNWHFEQYAPKSSRNIDKKPRYPLGRSNNRRWVEGVKRGYPDVVKLVKTPAGGLPGSNYSMLMRSLYTGVPGYVSGKQQQDDFILDSGQIPYLPITSSPSAVVRVYLPPFEKWEKRTGTSFGFRAELHTYKTEKKRRLFFTTTKKKLEPYWPGIFIQFNSKSSGLYDEDSAALIIRADKNGQDIVGPQITKTGWWTLGMSFSGDGMVHYYAKQGVGKLTERNFITSRRPYNFRGMRFNTIFFNVVNTDNGRSWSTDWIIDDPTVYWMGAGRQAYRSAYRR